MAENCGCTDIVIDNCPPYASHDSLVEVLDALCSNCSGSVPVGTANEDLIAEAGIDGCCQNIIIVRGNQIIYSYDGGTTWLETGSAIARYITAFGSTGFTVNVANTLAFTGVNTTEAENEIGASIASNSIFIPEGFYSILVTIELAYVTASALNITYELLENGAAASPRMITTSHFNGANPNTGIRYAQLYVSRRFDATTALRLQVLSGISITSNPFNVTVEITKLTN